MSANESNAIPKAEARTQAQRERILNAAQQCFVEHGFHAASMANIAETAEMSAGLIYRYFESKNEIIVAIIERQLEFLHAELAQLDDSVDLSTRFAEGCSGCGPGKIPGLSPALILEMSAEATRNTQIAAALAAFDAAVRTDIVDLLTRSKEHGGYGLSKDIAPARALMVQCLVEGLKVRATREPGIDKNILKSALDEVLSVLLSPPKQS